ncbi:MAG: amino acid ABC transporter substrate-binding protein [Spirochaetales bacterium]|nr:amino acid ABC transporter substrate-binding protein [Spirochaetales bacterium]
MKRRKIFIYGLLLVVSLVFLISGCTQKEDKTIIRIGASRSLTGPLAPIGDVAFGPILKMWVDEVNAAGGIYIKEYDKKLPVETVIYDDESKEDIMVRNLEKLIVEDKVDFIFPPIGTHLVLVAAPIVNKYKYLFWAAEGGASQIKEVIKGLPYFFSSLSFSTHNQVPVLADIMENLGVKTAAIVFLADDHGVEYSSAAVPQLALKGINVALVKSIPTGIKDMSDIINEAKTANVDAFCIFAYPDETLLSVGQSIELGFNPKLFITSVGANFAFFQQAFGPAAEGVMGVGAWNTKVSPGHKELAEKLVKNFGEGILDWWGHNLYYASLQFWQQAVEAAGTLDQETIRDIFAAQKFNTILGPTWFDENHLLATDCHSGEIGQWQNGIFEVIGPPDKATAKPVYPKPAWPSK